VSSLEARLINGAAFGAYVDDVYMGYEAQALAIFQDLRHPHAVQVRATLRQPGTPIHFDR
jgi:hypothetical protein